jgi:hypothetical protein
MESLTLDREAAHLKDELMPKYADLRRKRNALSLIKPAASFWS